MSEAPTVSKDRRLQPLLAARLDRDGDPEPIEFQETDTDFAIGWKGNYHIEGRAFLYAEREARRIITILGYPSAILLNLG